MRASVLIELHLLSVGCLNLGAAYQQRIWTQRYAVEAAKGLRMKHYKGSERLVDVS